MENLPSTYFLYKEVSKRIGRNCRFLKKDFKEKFSMVVEYGVNAEDWFYDIDRNDKDPQKNFPKETKEEREKNNDYLLKSAIKMLKHFKGSLANNKWKHVNQAKLRGEDCIYYEVAFDEQIEEVAKLIPELHVEDYFGEIVCESESQSKKECQSQSVNTFTLKREDVAKLVPKLIAKLEDADANIFTLYKEDKEISKKIPKEEDKILSYIN